jgi:hypothetical protein
MERKEKILTCFVPADPTNLLLLNRKIATSDIDFVDIEYPYEGTITGVKYMEEVVKHLPRFRIIGPVQIFDNFTEVANFPPGTDLDLYAGKEITVNIVKHIRNGLHIDRIFPRQRTSYKAPLRVIPSSFHKACERKNGELNIFLNIADCVYDARLSLVEETAYVLERIYAEANGKYLLNLYFFGFIDHERLQSFVQALSAETKALERSQVKFMDPFDLSHAIGQLLNSDAIITGPYGLSTVAYSSMLPVLSIVPFHLSYMLGKTIELPTPRDGYIETSDMDLDEEVVKPFTLRVLREAAMQRATLTAQNEEALVT